VEWSPFDVAGSLPNGLESAPKASRSPTEAGWSPLTAGGPAAGGSASAPNVSNSQVAPDREVGSGSAAGIWPRRTGWSKAFRSASQGGSSLSAAGQPGAGGSPDVPSDGPGVAAAKSASAPAHAPPPSAHVWKVPSPGRFADPAHGRSEAVGSGS